MKKSLIIILSVISVFIFSTIVGLLINKNYQIKSDYIIEEVVEQAKNENNIVVENKNIKEANSQEEKITPTTRLILKKYYNKCGHTLNSYVELPKEFVNMNKEQIQNEYKEWEVEKFSTKEVILIKDEEGFCNEHYLLKEKDGKIAVYLIDKAGQEVLKEITAISTEYLTQNDLLNIKEGIKIYGTEELNKTLEDYE